jgi:FkbM family methyltransferase
MMVKTTLNTEDSDLVLRARNFLRKSWSEKAHAVHRLLSRLRPGIPRPFRLPFGAWFIARNDALSDLLASGRFESAELKFVETSLKPGMTVLDIGANQGIYTLLASKVVGPQGKVFAFEPSPRDRKALARNLTLNRSKNVTVCAVALGDSNTQAVLFTAEPHFSGCSSLRPPAKDIPMATSPVEVSVLRLDDWIATSGAGPIDFIKLDVEGGELSVLNGAPNLLQARPRPIILAEVQDIRTAPWGYAAKEIIRALQDRSYKWFGLSMDGKPYPSDTAIASFEGNFVACPEERLPELAKLS